MKAGGLKACLHMVISATALTAISATALTASATTPGEEISQSTPEPRLLIPTPVIAGKLLPAPQDTVVTISATVKEIPPFAFAGMQGIKHIIWQRGSQCTKIGAHAFAHCPDLETAALPESITWMGEGVFRECTSLRSIKVPDGVTALPKEMCLRCESLCEAELPKGLRTISPFAFAGCIRLQSISIPKGVTEIGNNAFSSCASLTELDIPASVHTIESYAFSDCTSLQRLTLPSSCRELGELIVSGCSALRLICEPSHKVPTIECNSYLFDPDDKAAYHRCHLKVPHGRTHAYRHAHAWRLFRYITCR